MLGGASSCTGAGWSRTTRLDSWMGMHHRPVAVRRSLPNAQVVIAWQER
jgi:hypothetical protein